MTPSSNDPAEARKRRKEIIQSQRSENELSANGGATSILNGAAVTNVSNGVDEKNSSVRVEVGESSVAVTVDANGNAADKKPPKKRKVNSGDSSSRKNGKKDDSSKPKKTQIRYDPDVPMNKDQLAAWRREARRVRNRESAAASRQRIRNRISELEDEVGEWKKKYTAAIARLEALERHLSANGSIENSGAASSDPQPAEDDPAEQPSLEDSTMNPVAVPAPLLPSAAGMVEEATPAM